MPFFFLCLLDDSSFLSNSGFAFLPFAEPPLPAVLLPERYRSLCPEPPAAFSMGGKGVLSVGPTAFIPSTGAPARGETRSQSKPMYPEPLRSMPAPRSLPPMKRHCPLQRLEHRSTRAVPQQCSRPMQVQHYQKPSVTGAATPASSTAAGLAPPSGFIANWKSLTIFFRKCPEPRSPSDPRGSGRPSSLQ